MMRGRIDLAEHWVVINIIGWAWITAEFAGALGVLVMYR